MNTVVRAAVRWGSDQGHTMLGIYNGFPGLIKGDLKELSWMDVSGWVGQGGAEIGTNRAVPSEGDYYSIARTIEEGRIDGLLVVGGESGYDSVYEMFGRQKEFPTFRLPIVCLPATIDNDRPGSELNIGADLQYVASAARSIADHINEGLIIINKSTVPVGTGDWVSDIVREQNPDAGDFAVVSCPEFLREGSAISDFMQPPPDCYWLTR